MLRSFRVATVAGIGIYLHWTFLAVAGLALGISLSRLDTDPFAMRTVAFYAAVFFCVVLHELGHALAAQRFGIATSRITLLPIGGLAQLESPPKTALSELVIALAGPLVNVVIAVAISGSIWLSSGAVDLIRPSMLVTGFLRDLAIANAALVLFNMIPALPMDGGRVFRAVLSMISNQRRATMIASSLGKLIAVGFAVSGLFI
ncbi:MAG: site-2 protease family protein, partial [Planctomycetota bacterium]